MDFNIQALAIQFMPLMIAVVFHEFAHAWMALRFGDTTAKDQGRLTLNPVPHIDPVGTILLPVILTVASTGFLFAWAKPVPVQPGQFSDYRKGMFWVAFAGPGMNFILGFFSAAFLVLWTVWVSPEFYLFEPIQRMAEVSLFFNFLLGIFNLLPLPPLDGSKMIQSFMSAVQALKYQRLSQFSMFILVVLMFSGMFRYLMIPVHFLMNGAMLGANALFG